MALIVISMLVEQSLRHCVACYDDCAKVVEGDGLRGRELASRRMMCAQVAYSDQYFIE